MLKNQAGVLYQDLKHEAITVCFRSNVACTASFSQRKFENECFLSRKHWKRKSSVFLSHLTA